MTELFVYNDFLLILFAQFPAFDLNLLGCEWAVVQKVSNVPSSGLQKPDTQSFPTAHKGEKHHADPSTFSISLSHGILLSATLLWFMLRPLGKQQVSWSWQHVTAKLGY